MLSILRGSVAFSGYVLNTLFWFPVMMVFGLIKLIPFEPSRKGCSWVVDQIASLWISINNLNQKLLGGTRIDTGELPELSPDEWYLVVANHQSWVDILVLQRVFNRRIPFLKFFLKQELIYVPFMGLLWWALDFPFMRRYSKAFIEKNPHLKGKDLETTRKACAKFQDFPVSVMNFAEGTRFTTEKYKRQSSGYQRLLSPRAGGLAFALDAMNGKLQQMLDVTIYYPEGIPTFWDFLCGRVRKVDVRVTKRSLVQVLEYDYQQTQGREAFQGWVNEVWTEKDRQLEELAS
ncbi:acyltransferase [Endozoicomonadaceae bacterium StTr2]